MKLFNKKQNETPVQTQEIDDSFDITIDAYTATFDTIAKMIDEMRPIFEGHDEEYTMILKTLKLNERTLMELMKRQTKQFKQN